MYNTICMFAIMKSKHNHLAATEYESYANKFVVSIKHSSWIGCMWKSLFEHTHVCACMKLLTFPLHIYINGVVSFRSNTSGNHPARHNVCKLKCSCTTPEIVTEKLKYKLMHLCMHIFVQSIDLILCWIFWLANCTRDMCIWRYSRLFLTFCFLVMYLIEYSQVDSLFEWAKRV